MIQPGRHTANEQGTALLVTLAVVTVFLVSGLQLARLASDSVTVLGKENQAFLAQEIAMSGVHLAMMVLADDAAKNDIDSIQEDWADPAKLEQASAQLGYGKGVLSLGISDELGKLQVNALMTQFPGHDINPAQQRLWERFLALRISADKSEDERDPSAIINSLKDWLDSGDDDAVTGLTGAESDYYLGLEFPYASANGPVNTQDELMRIKGITPGLFASGKGEYARAAQKEVAPWAGAPDPGDLLTVYGMADARPGDAAFSFPGRVNINTARVEVIEALLPEGLEGLAQDLVDFRNERAEDTKTFVNELDKEWYTGVVHLSDEEKIALDKLIRYSSHLFRVDARADLDDAQIFIRAYVQRYQQTESRQWTCRLLQLEKVR